MKIMTEFEYSPTLDELANEIWNLDAMEQTLLLDKLYNIDDLCRVETQLSYLSVRLKQGDDRGKQGVKIIDGLYERIHEV